MSARLSSSTIGYAAAVVTLLAGAPARGDDWPSLGLDAARSRGSAERSGALFGPGRWELTLPKASEPIYRVLLASPAAADGYLVYGGLDGLVRGVAAADGRPLWEVRTGAAIHASPALWRGLAFVAGTDQTLYAIRLADGALAWKRDLGGIAYASPAVVGGSVFVAAGDPAARVHRIDAVSGKVLWTAGAGLFEQGPYASIAVADERVLVGESHGRLHSFAVADGALQWTAVTGGTVNLSSPLVIGDRVYLVPGGKDGGVHALELGTGRAVESWTTAVPMPVAADSATLVGREYVMSSPVALDGKIVFDRRVEDRLDTDRDGSVDSIALEEAVVAVDARDGAALWSAPNGRVVTKDPNRVPTHGVCPTPALYRAVSGQRLVAVASSLSPRLRVLDLSSGDERWSADLAAPTRGSPILVNGRLVVGTDAGVIHSFVSRTNQAPAAPVPLSPAGGRDVDAASVSLRWSVAIDPDRETASYEVRLDDDGEVLHDWSLAVNTRPAQLALDLATQLAPGHVYTFAVRARDAQGAWSAWSAPAQFRAVLAPSVQLDGAPVAGLGVAVATARAGSVITLGAGTFPLGSTLHLPAGVSLVGAAPHLTILSGQGLAVAVRAGQGNRLRQLTVSDAALGVEVTAGDDARLQNVILRDCAEAGLDVAPGAGAELVSATLVRNGTGVRARGTASVRNAILTANTVGIEAGPGFSGRYNDLFANRIDYQGTTASATDRTDVVVFADPEHDLRLDKAQGTTDRGDPTDDYADEPRPNGDRINLGAFGNTPFAELSALPPPPAPPEETSPEKRAQAPGGRCSLGSGGAPDGSLWLILAIFMVGRRRQAPPT